MTEQDAQGMNKDLVDFLTACIIVAAILFALTVLKIILG